MPNKTLLCTLATAFLFLSACAPKISVKVLEPAAVDAIASKKRVAIYPFANDSVALGGTIEALLAAYTIEGKPYFQALNRQSLEQLAQEHALQSSQMLDQKTAAEVGALVGAQVLIVGEVISADAKKGFYKEDREKCLQKDKEGKCLQFKHYKVTCHTLKADLAANISIVDVASAQSIYGDVLRHNYFADSCKNGTIYSDSQALGALSKELAAAFVAKLTPSYRYQNVELLDSLEYDDATDDEEEQFAYAIEYIEAQRFEKAESLLRPLMESFEGKAWSVSYNLGVIREAQGDYEDAKRFYTLADDAMLAPVDAINEAVVRIDTLIRKREHAKAQIDAR